MSLIAKINAHLENVKLYQTIFSLPFAYVGAFLGANGNPPIWDLVWITAVVVFARSAALAMDNLFDYKYDKKHSRVQHRPIVAGRITKGETKVFIAVCLVLFIVSVAQLDPICLKLMPLAALPFIIYPFTKRFTCLCHFFCGIAIAMAPAGGWIAVTAGDFSLPFIVLYLAVALWIGGFDMVFGTQDEEFDRKQGLHSMATAVGAKKALAIARATHVVCLIMLLWLGELLELGWFYYIGIAMAAVTLYYQHTLVTPKDFTAINRKYFLRNGIVSMSMFVCTVLSFHL